uniref:Uncharacterized protein n=1 Tax=viral metagenome TaxID=1070528 RepID=A0A6H1ZYD3_9ZZZZ
MAGFKRVKGADRGFIVRTISSLALVVGDLVAYSRSAYKVAKATNLSQVYDLAGIVVEATTTADTEVKLQRITPGDEYEVDVTNNSNATHNYQRMLLTDENAVNNTGTDNATDEAVFLQIGTVGTAANKKIVGEFDLFKKTA